DREQPADTKIEALALLVASGRRDCGVRHASGRPPLQRQHERLLDSEGIPYHHTPADTLITAPGIREYTRPGPFPHLYDICKIYAGSMTVPPACTGAKGASHEPRIVPGSAGRPRLAGLAGAALAPVRDAADGRLASAF